MHVADEMMLFFSNKKPDGKYFTLRDFWTVSRIPPGREQNSIITLRRLEQHGLIIPIPTFGRDFRDHQYESLIFLATHYEYGSYGFLVGGFQSIIEKFDTSVLPIPTRLDGEPTGVATGFIVTYKNRFWLVTARHVLIYKEDTKRVDSIDFGREDLTNSIVKLFIPTWNDPYINPNHLPDIAVFELAAMPTGIAPFIFGKPILLADVLIMGYPVLYGVELTLISSTGQISALDRFQRHYNYNVNLVSVRVKSGFSGSPVINELGTPVGMVISFGEGKDRDGKPDWDFQAHVLKIEDITLFLDKVIDKDTATTYELNELEVKPDNAQLHINWNNTH